MSIRKTILLLAIVILSAAYIIQLTAANKTTAKELKIEDSFDTITLESSQGTISIYKDADKWFIGEKKYPADSSVVKSIIAKLSNIKVVDTVASSVNATIQERYGLDEANAIKACAIKDSNVMRTILVGKTSSTGGQTYVQLDNDKSVYLVSGSLGAIFSSTQEQLRDNQILSDINNSIDKIELDGYTLAKMPAVNEDSSRVWTLLSSGQTSASELKLDDAKISAWASSISTLRASQWADENIAFPQEYATISILAAGKKITIQTARFNDEDTEKYICKSSTTPYLFYVNNHLGENLMKNIEDLM